ncbi:PLP-dependent transferase, partial [Cystobasidium minutum MCA 4210]|uniref:PLP-dependent transferase n=1 Tax=Cystobasidium minutum MCA 4210 TaxID=1397322 RepID=UPI0034CD5E1E|eukprot:jgi/Rhomi1/169930/fgenesh1_kg.3_\
MTSLKTSKRIEQELGKSDVWSVFSPAGGHVPKDSLNLGQGFMDWSPPEYIRSAAEEAIDRSAETNHYSIPRGRARLRNALASYLSPSFNLPEGRQLDPTTEILVTSGANVGMYSCLAAFLDEGDEVIVPAPHFDQYISSITFHGGKPVYVPFRPPKEASHSNVSSSEWKLDIEELRAACTDKTRVLILNTPHNPIGKVFSEDELREIGNLAEEKNFLILSDEVYDVLALKPSKHVRIASLDNFWKRTITVGSAGKNFSCTGWRIGWLIGPADLIRACLAASTRVTFCTNSPLQEAAAAGFEQADEQHFFENQREWYEKLRDTLLTALDKLGLPYTIPQGSYFVLVNTSRLHLPEDWVVPDIVKDRPRDWQLAFFVAQTAGVVCIPPTDFYPPHLHDIGSQFLRIAFCKQPETIEAAGERLLKLKPYI